MCGLVGLFNKNTNGFSKDQQELFTTLLYVNYLRGQDSTGAFSVSNTGEVFLAKEASSSATFQRSKEYKDMLQRAWMNGSCMIGHSRAATRGTVNDENAHPFVVDDNIVLVHNGTMYGDHKKIANVEVDSHAIAHAIHEKKSVTEALSSFEAAYALIWYDFKERKLNLIRNAWRPLWWVETSTSWLWASERSMLEFAMARNPAVTIKDGPHELPEDTLQVYSLETRTWEISSEALKITKPKANNHSETEYSSGWNQHRGRVWPSAARDQAEDTRFEMRDAIRQQTNNVIPLPGPLTKVDPEGTTGHFQRELARASNKIVTQQEYHDDVIPSYPSGTSVIAVTFDYCFANQKDSKGGYYLYSYIIDDPDVIVRQFFDAKFIEEDRIMLMASGEYVYRFTVGRKSWAAMAPGAVVPRSPGYVILESEKATLLSGGGIESANYKPTDEEKAKVH